MGKISLKISRNGSLALVILILGCDHGFKPAATVDSPALAQAAADTQSNSTLEHALPSEITYRGYKIDLTKLKDRTELATVLQSIYMQIDVVEAASVNKRVKSFFRGLTISVVPALGDLGKYKPRGVVDMNYAVIEPDKIVLLHEMLHAYHDMVLGFDDPDISAYYTLAKDNRLFPNQSYMMQNSKEFFAVTASVVVHIGGIDREPFDEPNLRSIMPAYREYLRSLLQ